MMRLCNLALPRPRHGCWTCIHRCAHTYTRVFIGDDIVRAACCSAQLQYTSVRSCMTTAQTHPIQLKLPSRTYTCIPHSSRASPLEVGLVRLNAKRQQGAFTPRRQSRSHAPDYTPAVSPLPETPTLTSSKRTILSKPFVTTAPSLQSPSFTRIALRTVTAMFTSRTLP
jgi:hypothetical protein